MAVKPTYENPLTTRYASRAMRELFSPDERYRSWRELWIALARAEKRLGLPITDGQVEAMEAAAAMPIDYDRVAALEKELRHDVMAHLHAFAEHCPDAKPILHLGATSCYVTDNSDLLLLRRGMDLILTSLVNVVEALADLAEKWRDLPTIGYTHFQTAQPVTVGKRACLWLQDALLDLDRLEFEIGAFRIRGVKGTTGTQASFLELFEGDEGKVKELDRLVAEELGTADVFPVTGQTYPRKVDYAILSVLSGIGQSAHKFANDIRLLMHMDEVEEPFTKSQIGSSAMPYKRNPMRTERMTALARFLISVTENAAQTAAEQWLERTLDDSANRRISLPQAFLAADAILTLQANVARGLNVHETVVANNLRRELPFLATERILMLGVKAGGDRQVLHERIRVHALGAKTALREGAVENDLLDRLRADPAFAAVADDLDGLLDPSEYVGRAPAQVDEFVDGHVRPRLEEYADRLGQENEVRV
ncbi:MAG: adenylosuccinate lyase [Planctomycetota bacterium]